jgi:hypothetical protein
VPTRVLIALLALGVAVTPSAAARAPRASDFRCLTEGTRPAGKNFFIFHRSRKKLRKAVAIAKRDRPGDRYPVGTIIQLLPGEAMAKRNKGWNPAGNDWEWFQLGVDERGKTTILSRGREEVKNFASCQGCHLTGRAAQFDLVCEGHSSLPILFTPEQVRRIQENDPRCRKPAPAAAH